MLVPWSGMTAARRSSTEPRAVAWNRYICSTIAEISFEPGSLSPLSHSSIRLSGGSPYRHCPAGTLHYVRRPFPCCPIRPHQQWDRFRRTGPPIAWHLAPRPRPIAAAVGCSANHAMRLGRHAFCLSQNAVNVARRLAQEHLPWDEEGKMLHCCSETGYAIHQRSSLQSSPSFIFICLICRLHRGRLFRGRLLAGLTYLLW